MNQNTECWVYRSSRKDEMYLYLASQDDFNVVPKPLLDRFGNPALVMQLAVWPGRKLARVDAGALLDSLAKQGFYLQMPPKLVPDMYYGNDL